MPHLTIDNLKTALISYGIQLPSNADEKEYIALYRKHISPLKNIQIKKKTYNQLSSDDDDDEHNSSSKKVRSEIYTKMSKTLSESEINSLSDEQLYKELSSLNVAVGPIVASTRKIYQRKLMILMGGDVVDSFNGDVDDEYSDSDSDPHTKQDNSTESNKVIKKSFYSYEKSPPSTLRSRVTTESPLSTLESSLNFDHDRHTPSPRPSLRTVSSTSSSGTKHTTSAGTYRETQSVRHTYTYPSEKRDSSEGATSSFVRRLLVKCLFVLIILAVLYFTYQYLYSESPLKGLKSLAQQASDLANGNPKKEAKVRSKP